MVIHTETSNTINLFSALFFDFVPVDCSSEWLLPWQILKSLLKKKTPNMMRVIPIRNEKVSTVLNNNVDIALETITDTPVASPFCTLSVYLMTAATSKPPPPRRKTCKNTHGVNPKKKPFCTSNCPEVESFAKTK